MAEFMVAVQQHRYPLAPACFQRGMLIHVEHLDVPAILVGNGLERIDQNMAQMTPLSAEHSEALAISIHFHHSALRLTKDL